MSLSRLFLTRSDLYTSQVEVCLLAYATSVHLCNELVHFHCYDSTSDHSIFMRTQVATNNQQICFPSDLIMLDPNKN